MSTRPRKPKPGGLSPTGCESTQVFGQAVDAASHQSGNSQVSWTIPPGGDGFQVEVSSAGRIRLTQHPPFGNEVEIVLHPDEALKLLEILHTAIDEAAFIRHGGPSFE